MRSPELSDDGRTVIRGSYVDIFLENQGDQLDDYLRNVTGFRELWSSQPKEMMEPIERVSLDYSHEASDDIGIHAGLEFDAAIIGDEFDVAWDELIRDSLLAKLHDIGNEIYVLPHQRQDFYVRVNGAYAVGVKFDTSTHSCHVSLILERLSEIYFASNGKLAFEPDPDEVAETAHVETLREFSQILSVTIDTISMELGVVEGEETPKPRVVIAAPQPAQTSYDDDVDFISLKEGFDINGVPEIELNPSGPRGIDSVGGLTHAKQRLHEIADMMKNPEGAQLYGVKPRHFLLHGPPGTGKTTLIEAFAQEINAHVMPVDSTSFVDMWVGNSGKHVRHLFEAVRKRAEDGEPIVVMMDEFDTLARRGNSGTGEREDVKKKLNKEIDRLSAECPNVIIAAATNADIMDLEDSLVRSNRIEPVGAPLPNYEERVDIWGAVLLRSMVSFNVMGNLPVYDRPHAAQTTFMPYADDIDLPDLANRTDGMTGADFVLFHETAPTEKFQHYHTTGERLLVTHADLVRAIAQRGR